MSQREPYVQRPCGRRAFPFMMVRGGSSNWSTCVKENREVAGGHPGGATSSIWVFRIMVTGVPACDGGEVHHMEGRGSHVLIR